MPTRFEYKEFAANLNTKFRIHVDESATVESELTEISEHFLSPRQERFAIVFRGPNDLFLGQGTRRIQHKEMGEFDLFLVPIARDEKGFYYEAVFNRPVKTD